MLLTGVGGGGKTVAGDTYVFIDGGHLRKYHAEVAEKWFGAPTPDLDLYKVGADLGAWKCFYYDCLDDIKRASESQSDFDNRLSKQEELYSKFRRTLATHVRLGALTGQGKKIRQKQVDIMLAVDAMSHAARGNMRTVKIVSGDQDFTPLVEALVNMGLNVQVIGDSKHTSQTLADAADTFRALRFVDYFNWTDEAARRARQIASYSIGGHPSVKNTAIQPCTVAGIEAKHFFYEGRFFITFVSPEAKQAGDGNSAVVHHEDKLRLQLFCELQFGEVVW